MSTHKPGDLLILLKGLGARNLNGLYVGFLREYELVLLIDDSTVERMFNKPRCLVLSSKLGLISIPNLADCLRNARFFE